MQNDPELNGKYLGNITKDFVLIADTLKEASYLIRKRNFSAFPIFPICRQPQAIGQLLVEKKDANLEWNFYASFLEEFEQRQLIEGQGVELFKQTYKNPEEYCCLFVIDLDFTNYVFVPYPEE
jgi:hypothetical protein